MTVMAVLPLCPISTDTQTSFVLQEYPPPQKKNYICLRTVSQGRNHSGTEGPQLHPRWLLCNLRTETCRSWWLTARGKKQPSTQHRPHQKIHSFNCSSFFTISIFSLFQFFYILKGFGVCSI